MALHYLAHLRREGLEFRYEDLVRMTPWIERQRPIITNKSSSDSYFNGQYKTAEAMRKRREAEAAVVKHEAPLVQAGRGLQQAMMDPTETETEPQAVAITVHDDNESRVNVNQPL